MAKKTNVQILEGFPEMAEHLHNVIQDAQAAGAIVQIITIFPASGWMAEGDVAANKSCNPKDTVCPKGAR